MNKFAFVFPGQGSQAVGMGKDLYENHAAVKRIFQEADEALGFSLTKMCFEGPEEELRKTFNTQPAILTVSVAAAEMLKEEGLVPHLTAGHSLGEYSALVTAGAVQFADAVRLVRKRGQFMQDAVPLGEGGMAAVLGMEREDIIRICQEVEGRVGPVQAVNFNCPGQVVIAGKNQAVTAACEALKEAKARKIVELPVSAPFHSTLMKPAAEKLAAELEKTNFVDAKLPVVANVNGRAVTKSSEIKQLLVTQAAAPVLWEDCMAAMLAEGVETFVEVGPGKVLTGFMKKIDKSRNCLNIEDQESLEKTLAYFKEVR